MANFLCRTSEEKLWADIFESCQRRTIVLDRNTSRSATIGDRSFMSTLWNVELTTLPSERPKHALLTIQAVHTLKAKCLYRGFGIAGLGMLIIALGLWWQYDQSGLSICMFLFGMVALVAALLFSLFTNHHVQKLIAKMLQDLRSDINLQKLEPFEVRESWRFKAIVISLAIIFLLQIAIFTGPILGTITFGVSGAVFFELFVVVPRLTSWRRILHVIHTKGTQDCARAFMSIMVTFMLGAIVYCRTYHRSEFNSENGIADNILRLACTSPHGWVTSPETVARKMAIDLSLPMVETWAIVIIILLGTAIFLRAVFRGILSGLRYWQFTNLSEHPPIGPVVPLSNSPRRLDNFLVVINALFSGVIYWSTAIVSIDALSYLLFGRALVFLPIGWSLEYFNILLTKAGIPALMAYILVLIMLTLASLPGLALTLTALNRMIRGVWSTLTYMFPSNHLSMDMTTIHGEWLKRTCLQAGIRPARFRVIDSQHPMLSSERSLIPFLRGRIVISLGCRELFSKLETRALLAHEIYHIKHSALYIQALKALSTLLLCPMYYLLILYDFAHNEYEADTFAVSVVKDVETFKTALIKLQVASSIRRERSDNLLFKRCFRWLRSRSCFFQALPLYFNNSILGAAYPTLQERFAHIDRLWVGKENKLV